MDIKSFILKETSSYAIVPIPYDDLELAFGIVAAKESERPLPEIVEHLSKWCEENRLKYLYKPTTKEYVFTWLDWKFK